MINTVYVCISRQTIPLYYSQKTQNITVAHYYAAEEEVEEPPEEPAPEPEPEVAPEPEPEPEYEPVLSLVEISEPDNELKLENYEIKNVVNETKEENQAQVKGCSTRQKEVVFEKSGLNTQQV